MTSNLYLAALLILAPTMGLAQSAAETQQDAPSSQQLADTVPPPPPASSERVTSIDFKIDRGSKEALGVGRREQGTLSGSLRTNLGRGERMRAGKTVHLSMYFAPRCPGGPAVACAAVLKTVIQDAEFNVTSVTGIPGCTAIITAEAVAARLTSRSQFSLSGVLQIKDGSTFDPSRCRAIVDPTGTSGSFDGAVTVVGRINNPEVGFSFSGEDLVSAQ